MLDNSQVSVACQSSSSVSLKKNLHGQRTGQLGRRISLRVQRLLRVGLCALQASWSRSRTAKPVHRWRAIHRPGHGGEACACSWNHSPKSTQTAAQEQLNKRGLPMLGKCCDLFGHHQTAFQARDRFAAAFGTTPKQHGKSGGIATQQLPLSASMPFLPSQETGGTGPRSAHTYFVYPSQRLFALSRPIVPIAAFRPDDKSRDASGCDSSSEERVI